MIQSLLDKEKSTQFFEEYMQEAYPWMGTARVREREEHIKMLKDWVSQGPLQISAAPSLNDIKSRLKPAPSKPPVSARDMNKIYGRMDSIRRGRT